MVFLYISYTIAVVVDPSPVVDPGESSVASTNGYTAEGAGDCPITLYSRTPIYRDTREKGFCPVNQGGRYIGVKYR